MEEQNKQEREGKIPLNSTASGLDLRSKFLLALIVIGVVALGLLAVNQFLSFMFKADFLNSPCDLCERLNPHLAECFHIESINRTSEYNIKINNNTNPFTLS